MTSKKRLTSTERVVMARSTVGMTTFRGLAVVRETTADRLRFRGFTIKKDMTTYSGWDWLDHLEWVCELTGLCYATLVSLVSQGYMVLTDEECSEVWLLCRDYYRTKCRLLGPA